MEKRIEWRRHPFTLLAKTWPILLQLLGLSAALVVPPIFYRDVSASTVAVVAVLLCCVVTAIFGESRWIAVRGSQAETVQTRRELLARMSKPWRYIIIGFTFLFAGFIAATVLFIGPVFFAPAVGLRYLWITVSLYYAFLFGWLWLEYVDWRNEHYVLTLENIIEIARIPIFYSRRTEVPLAQVQNVTASQTFFGGLFGYGRVVVETAGRTQAVVFEDAPAPYNIQQLVFQYIDRFHEQELEQRRKEWADQTVRWFQGYHDLTGHVECQHYPPQVQAGHPARIQWRVHLPPETGYITNLHWDTGSHVEDDGYPNRTPVLSGSGSGWHSALLVAMSPGPVYFKARVAVPTNGELYSTTEKFYTVTDTDQAGSSVVPTSEAGLPVQEG